MYVVVIVLIVIVAVFLVLVVLAQNPKGSGSFGGGMPGSQIIGVKRSGDLLEKLTWGFGIGIMVLALSSKLIIQTTASGDTATKSVLEENIGEGAALPQQSLDEEAGLEEEPAVEGSEQNVQELGAEEAPAEKSTEEVPTLE